MKRPGSINSYVKNNNQLIGCFLVLALFISSCSTKKSYVRTTNNQLQTVQQIPAPERINDQCVSQPALVLSKETSVKKPSQTNTLSEIHNRSLAQHPINQLHDKRLSNAEIERAPLSLKRKPLPANSNNNFYRAFKKNLSIMLKLLIFISFFILLVNFVLGLILFLIGLLLVFYLQNIILNKAIHIIEKKRGQPGEKTENEESFYRTVFAKAILKVFFKFCVHFVVLELILQLLITIHPAHLRLIWLLCFYTTLSLNVIVVSALILLSITTIVLYISAKSKERMEREAK